MTNLTTLLVRKCTFFISIKVGKKGLFHDEALLGETYSKNLVNGIGML